MTTPQTLPLTTLQELGVVGDRIAEREIALPLMPCAGGAVSKP